MAQRHDSSCMYVLQHEMIPGASKDQEALLIALKRPIIFVLPAAFDKGLKFLLHLMFELFHLFAVFRMWMELMLFCSILNHSV